MPTFTIGSGGTDNYADPILWSNDTGNTDYTGHPDGALNTGVMQENITMTQLFRPNQSWPNGGLLKGVTPQTGVLGVGQKLGNTNGTRICLAPSPNLDFEDIEWDLGANTYTIQNLEGSTLTRSLHLGENGSTHNISIIGDVTPTFNNCVLEYFNFDISTTSGTVTLNNCLLVQRPIVRNNNTIVLLNTASLAADWLLGRGTYAGSDSLVNWSYLTENAPAGDFGAGSSDNTYPYAVSGDIVSVGTDYRTASGSTMATGGQGGTFVGAFLEVAAGGVTADIDVTIPEPIFSVDGSATLPQPSANIDLTIPKPVFSVDASATLPQPSATVDITIPEPLFSVSGSATLPFPTANIDITIPEPQFSISGSATLPQPVASVDLTIPEPVFNVSASATLPFPIADVAITIPEPIFSITGSATVTGNVASIDFEIPEPVFNVSGSATLPQPIANVDLTIPAPVFSVRGSVSGLEIIPSYDAVLLVDYKSNTLII